MRATGLSSSGMSLIEMLIVIAALATLAVLVQPQLSLASDGEIKAELEAELEHIEGAIERHERRRGELPTLGESAVLEGWAALIDEGELIEPPINAYTGGSRVIAGGLGVALSHGPGSDVGWVWDMSIGVLHAAGYERERQMLFHERSFADVR